MKRTKKKHAGFTLIELMIVVAILMTIAGIGIPFYNRSLDKAKDTRAIEDVGRLQQKIDAHFVLRGTLPASLDDIHGRPWLDPWGNPYQYLDFATVKGKGQMRKDRFLVPLNSTYDLYSLGKDGQSMLALTAKASWDDIIRANDGGYVGLASEY